MTMSSRTTFASSSFHLDPDLDVVYKVPRAVADTEAKFTFGDSPDLSLDIPYR